MVVDRKKKGWHPTFESLYMFWKPYVCLLARGEFCYFKTRTLLCANETTSDHLVTFPYNIAAVQPVSSDRSSTYRIRSLIEFSASDGLIKVIWFSGWTLTFKASAWKGQAKNSSFLTFYGQMFHIMQNSLVFRQQYVSLACQGTPQKWRVHPLLLLLVCFSESLY